MKQLLFLFGCLVLLISCQNKADVKLERVETGPVVAEVGDKKFYDTDIDFEIMTMPESMRYIMQDDEVRGQVLDVMIKREVIAQKAKEMGLNRDPLIAYRLQKAKDEAMIQGVRDWQKADFKKPTQAELQAYYGKHTDEFMIPKQIHARHILVADKQTAVELLKQLKAKPESFETLAAQFSIDDSTKGRGGDLNWFSRGEMVKPFDDAVFALNKKKRFSLPINTDFGWHIIEWLGEREQQVPEFKDVKNEIMGILEKEKLNAWLEKLMDNANIEVKKDEYVLQK